MNKRDLTIIKIGSNTLIDGDKTIRQSLIDEILSLVSRRIQNGEKIIIISSGAVALGRAALHDDKRVLSKAVVAGVGQVNLIAGYFESAKKLNLLISDLLITRPHLVDHEQFLKLQETVAGLLGNNIIPIVNENDALVSGSDWAFGDNDSLAASLAIAFGARRLIILSHVDGLYDGDPAKDPQAKFIPEVKDANAMIMKFCSKDTSALGSGGMVSKLKAARLCAAVGIETRIVNGLLGGALDRALNDESIGTVFIPLPAAQAIKNRDRWILSAKSSAGSIMIDDGAEAALCRGKSLLAVGVKKVYGSFDQKEIVELVNGKKEGIAFGIVDVSSKNLEKVLKSDKTGVQVMHADNIMIYHGVCVISKK
ncbi:MAG: glutamate 5-kinase [Candidatus Magasanikbacteria bacterium]